MVEWNPYNAACPTRMALDQVGNKWSVLILGLLAEETHRFNQLRRKIDGISQKMLTQTLRELERNGLVSRAVFATVPVTVEYSLTPLGRTLEDAVAPLRDWAEAHIEQVLAARSNFDENRTP
jgi:DNA-binding HxlR family transcriptional regulator